MKKVYIRLLCIAVTFTLLIFTGGSLRESAAKDEAQVATVNELPPSMQVAGVALGPLRGLLVDALWWRSERMMEDKEFFEALQLSQWITSLQPTYPSVWSYQGFNLAFNISHNFSDFEERWNWIHEGIKLLRNKGIEYNPDWDRNRDIRFELVHIFYRKIEGISDTEARRFQDKWTLEMLKYFPRGDRQELEALAAAPKSLDELFADENVKNYTKLLQEQRGIDYRLIVQTQPPTRDDFLPDKPENRLHNYVTSKTIFYLQRKAIEEELNMDVERILKTDISYGPLDWRTHQAQIIYWGVEQDYEKFKHNGANYSEYVRAAMLSSFYNGRVLFSEKGDYFQKTHNIKILPKLNDFFSFLLNDSGLNKESKEFKRLDRIYQDFLERAIVITYTYNQLEASKKLFEHYQVYLPKNQNIKFEQYVLNGLTRSIKVQNTNARRSFIESILFKAYGDAARGEWDRYHGYLKIARLIHRAHQLENKDIPAKQLAPLKDIAGAARKTYLESTGKDEKDLKDLESRAETYSNPEKLKVR